jgi:hypothetical protein
MLPRANTAGFQNVQKKAYKKKKYIVFVKLRASVIFFLSFAALLQTGFCVVTREA